MQAESKKFLYKLLTTPSPTSHEHLIQKVVKARMQKYADTIETDLHGNLIVGINTKAKRRVMLAGHCDQIGFSVQNISDNGFLYIGALGGIDTTVLLGTHVEFMGKKGPVTGVIGKKPIHLVSAGSRGKLQVEFSKIWVDIGAKNRKEAEKVISVGDPGTFKLGVTELQDGLISSPGLDDKAGLFIVMEALRLCARSKLNVALYAVSTVQEEVGLRGATTSSFGVDPEIGIGVDVTFATDDPGNSDKTMRQISLGKGPTISRGPNTNRIVHERLVAAAKKGKIPYQIDPSNRPNGNDTGAIQVTRDGVATAHIGVPNRYMHTQVEVCSLKDLELGAKLLASFVKNIGARTSFKP